jgi:signal transduction histidine kinase
MRLSIKTKQVAGVTAIVGLAVIVLSGWYLVSLAQVLFAESRARADLIAKTAYQQAFNVLAAMPSGADPNLALRNDPGLRSILESRVYAADLLYAAIVDPEGLIVVHNDVTLTNQSLEPAGDLAALVDTGSTLEQLRTIFTSGGRKLEVRHPLRFGADDLGSLRVGVSTLLVRSDFEARLTTALLTTLAVLIGASLVAMLLAQVSLRPIHVIRGGLARLGRGETDVNVELPRDDELDELGDSFKQVTARLAAGRTELAGQKATLESVVDQLEDAVALFAPDGTLLFANPAMRPALGAPMGTVRTLFPTGHPYRTSVEAALTAPAPNPADPPASPVAVDVSGAGERLLLAQAVRDAQGRPIAVMLVSRNLAYLAQVETTLSYSRKLAALSRLTAGIAHEIKNPLNASMIHLELLKMKVASSPDALEHVSVIANQVRRLDEVVQGLLKFTRPEDLRLEPVYLAQLIADLMPIISAEAGGSGVDVRVDVPADLPPAQADPRLLSQAFLNLALNACQAMPDGGKLRITARAKPNRRLEIAFEDSGCGIPAEDLPHIFDLYFTRRAQGSGIGLSLVFRTVQLHDGDIEVQSSPGRGTTFTVQLRQARAILAPAMAAPAS